MPVYFRGSISTSQVLRLSWNWSAQKSWWKMSETRYREVKMYPALNMHLIWCYGCIQRCLYKQYFTLWKVFGQFTQNPVFSRMYTILVVCGVFTHEYQPTIPTYGSPSLHVHTARLFYLHFCINDSFSRVSCRQVMDHAQRSIEFVSFVFRTFPVLEEKFSPFSGLLTLLSILPQMQRGKLFSSFASRFHMWPFHALFLLNSFSKNWYEE